MKYILTTFLLLFIFSCKTPEPRNPIVKKSGQFLKNSASRNKELRGKEEKQIKKIIQKDSAHTSHSSSGGFWYHYEKEEKQDTATPHYGDVVKFTYDISDIEGTSIYSEEEIGMREYAVDRENIISGLRLGLKLMKEGEKVTFYFPSYLAFGYYGDNEKIGRNLPIKTTVTLQSITADNEHEINQNYK